ncbi:hypothetical protein DFH06DRAFT_1432687 [Mycena polygramma]|nr:hypothetical protein DFH06DRAFT_1432687 [Mycena polygramma]
MIRGRFRYGLTMDAEWRKTVAWRRLQSAPAFFGHWRFGDVRTFGFSVLYAFTLSLALCASLSGFGFLIPGSEVPPVRSVLGNATLEINLLPNDATYLNGRVRARGFKRNTDIPMLASDSVPSHKLGSGDQSLKEYPSTTSVAPPGASSPFFHHSRRPAVHQASFKLQVLHAPYAYYGGLSDPSHPLPNALYASPEMTRTLAFLSVGLALTRLAACPSPARAAHAHRYCRRGSATPFTYNLQLRLVVLERRIFALATTLSHPFSLLIHRTKRLRRICARSTQM